MGFLVGKLSYFQAVCKSGIQWQPHERIETGEAISSLAHF